LWGYFPFSYFAICVFGLLAFGLFFVSYTRGRPAQDLSRRLSGVIMEISNLFYDVIRRFSMTLSL